MAEAKTAKGAALCYMMVRFTPHFPPISPRPPLLYLYLFLSFRATALGQVHLQGVWIEMHWSLAHWKQACPPPPFFFLYQPASVSLSSYHWYMHSFSGVSWPETQARNFFTFTYLTFLIDEMNSDHSNRRSTLNRGTLQITFCFKGKSFP